MGSKLKPTCLTVDLKLYRRASRYGVACPVLVADARFLTRPVRACPVSPRRHSRYGEVATIRRMKSRVPESRASRSKELAGTVARKDNRQ